MLYRTAFLACATLFSAAVSTAWAAEGDKPLNCYQAIGDKVDFTGKIESLGGQPGNIASVRQASCMGSRFAVVAAQVPATCTDGKEAKVSGTIDADDDPQKPRPVNFMADFVRKTYGSEYYRVAASSVTCQ